MIITDAQFFYIQHFRITSPVRRKISTKCISIKTPRFFDQLHVLDHFLFGTGGRYLGRRIFPFFDPFGKTFNLCLLRFIIFFLLCQCFFFLLYKCRIISRIPFHAVIFNLICHINDPVQKSSVMGNDDNRIFIFLQIIFQPFNGWKIQMVCRLIQ